MIAVSWNQVRLLSMKCGWKIKIQLFESVRAETITFNTRQGADVLGLPTSFIRHLHAFHSFSFHRGKQWENNIISLCGHLLCHSGDCILNARIAGWNCLAQFTLVQSSDQLGCRGGGGHEKRLSSDPHPVFSAGHEALCLPNRQHNTNRKRWRFRDFFARCCTQDQGK